jgi:hypothetical protein
MDKRWEGEVVYEQVKKRAKKYWEERQEMRNRETNDEG